MKKTFVTNLAFLLGLNLLIKPFWIFGIDRSVQNALGPGEYGIYYALFNFSFLFNIILDVGITNFNNRNISQNQHLLEKHLPGIILLKILLAVAFVGISCFLAWLLGYQVNEFRLLLVMLFNQVLISFILYLRSNLAGLHLFKTDSVISVLDRSIMILICGTLLWTNLVDKPFRIEWFIWSQTIAYLFTAVVALIILSGKSRLKKLSWNWPFILMILKQSYPFAILVLLMTFSYRIDSVMLERMLPDGALQTGIYAQAYRLLDAAAMISYLFAALLLPMFARMIKLKENIEDLTRLSFSLIIVPAIFAASAGIVYGGPVMELLYHQHAGTSANILRLLLPCFIALSTSYIFGTLLTANGSLKYLNYTALAGMILNVTLNFILIPVYKVTGAAISCLITQVLTALVQVMIAKKVFGFKTNISFVARLLSFAMCSLGICFALFMLPIGWEWSLLLAAGCCIFLSFVVGVIRWNDLYQLTLKPGI